MADTTPLSELYKKAYHFEFLTVEEGMYLYQHAPLAELMHEIGRAHV